MTATIDPMQKIINERARGDFAYWSEVMEAEWKASAPEKPETPFGLPGYVRVLPNEHSVLCRGEMAKYATWEGAIAGGKSYLCGEDYPTERYLRECKSNLTDWQREAYAWCVSNPYWKLSVEYAGKIWVIGAVLPETTISETGLFGAEEREVAYVRFRLPYHDHGGEKTYISRDGHTKIKTDDD